MRDAQHVEIGLVDRIDHFADEFRHEDAEPREIPGHGDEEGENEIGGRKPHHHARIDQTRQPLRAAERAPGAEHEQELPGEWIEHPIAARIGGDVPVERPRQRVKHSRNDERQRRRAQQQPQHGRKSEQQHDIQRQHVHVHRLELQQQRLDHGDVGLLEEIEHAHFLAVERIVEARRDIGDFGEVDGEQEDVRDINLPGALEQAGGGDDEAVLAHRTAVDEGRGIAGDEDKDLSGVGKAVIADRDPAHRVGWDMVEEDQPQGYAAEQVQPQIAFGRNRGHEWLFFPTVFAP